MLPQDLDPPDRRIRALSWVVGLMLVLGVGACLSEGADSPDDPQLLRVEIKDREFGVVAFQVMPADPAAPPPAPNQLRCALLAATDAERQRGLMEVEGGDIEGYVGMVFRYTTDSQGGFHMRRTRIPLSIAWFDANGVFLNAADMAPCPDTEPSCPVYAASAPFRYALEVPVGKLGELGIGPGSKLVLTRSPCPD